MVEYLFKNRKEWREWLTEHHEQQKEIWLIYYKKHVNMTSIKYEEAVEEALCFGWIDSIVRRIDDERYMQKYTPRKDRSNWSASNKKRVSRLMEQGRMTRAGISKVDIAKRNGSWERLDRVERLVSMPDDLLDALSQNSKARKNFERFAPSSKKQYLWWLESAKREATRKKRIQEIVRRSEENIKPGIR